jgi:hypothetical protein
MYQEPTRLLPQERTAIGFSIAPVLTLGLTMAIILVLS